MGKTYRKVKGQLMYDKDTRHRMNSRSCLNHGQCPYCLSNRLYSYRRDTQESVEDILKGEYMPTITKETCSYGDTCPLDCDSCKSCGTCKYDNGGHACFHEDFPFDGLDMDGDDCPGWEKSDDI